MGLMKVLTWGFAAARIDNNDDEDCAAQEHSSSEDMGMREILNGIWVLLPLAPSGSLPPFQFGRSFGSQWRPAVANFEHDKGVITTFWHDILTVPSSFL